MTDRDAADRMYAAKVALMLKAIERADVFILDFCGNLAASKARDSVKFGIGAHIRIEMTWAKIRETGETELTEFILMHMREQRPMLN